MGGETRKHLIIYLFMRVHARSGTHVLCALSLSCQDNAESLYQLADKYDMQDVCAHISRCVLPLFTPSLLVLG